MRRIQQATVVVREESSNLARFLQSWPGLKLIAAMMLPLAAIALAQIWGLLHMSSWVMNLVVGLFLAEAAVWFYNLFRSWHLSRLMAAFGLVVVAMIMFMTGTSTGRGLMHSELRL